MSEEPYPELDTPSLLIHLDVLEANIAEMASVARDAGVRLRPHTKTHKSPEIARMQLGAGASGITVAKLGEAEVMADAGIEDLLVAYPIVGERKLARLRALLERARVRTTTDSVEVASGLGGVGRELGRPVEVLVEVDTGLHRLGRPPGEPTAALVAEVSRIEGLDVIGLLTHAGHAYGCGDLASLRTAAEREGLDLVETAERCAKDGIALRELSVGSTPTARTVAAVAGVTEIRPGTYVFNDVQQMRLGVATKETCAARVLATVVSRQDDGRFAIDAGSVSVLICRTNSQASSNAIARSMRAGRRCVMTDRMFETSGARPASASRKSYTVTLSIVAHVAALLALVVTPLVATGVLPGPGTVIIFTAPPSPPPPAPPVHPEVPHAVEVPPTLDPNVVPLVAPDRLAPEPPAHAFTPLPGVSGGVPAVLSSN